MRARGVVLLLLTVPLLIQQLPLDPGTRSKTPACCLLSAFCPMSARPAAGAKPSMGEDCDMASKSGRAACVIRARCGSESHGGAAAATAVAWLAVLDGWVGSYDAPDDPRWQTGDALALTRDSRPPTPPPRQALA